MDEKVLQNAMYHVVREVVRSERTHGEFKHGVIRGIAILTEEVGEAAQEALRLTNTRTAPGNTALLSHKHAALISELAQVAGVALHMIAKLEEEGYQL